MKVCVIGHFSENRMEGVRNVSKEIVNNLKNSGLTIFHLNIGIILPLKEIKKFNPDIIHFILSPTIGGLLLAKITSIIFPKCIIVSSIHSSMRDSFFLRFLKPDLMFVQSTESEFFFKRYGYRTESLPNGVDIERFKPCDETRKNELRKNLNIPAEKCVILHLASLKKERNLAIFEKIQEDPDCFVLIVGRENDNSDPVVVTQLRNSGCTVLIKNIDRIEDIYNVADCYVFPTIDKTACIETPLSVLEAMSSNLPVITTKFGNLPRMFQSGDGLYWIEDFDHVHEYINLIKSKKERVNTRQKVQIFSWKAICTKICDYYEKVLY